MVYTTSNERPTAQVPGDEKPRIQVSANHRRKIFYLLDSLNVGGTETQAVELARRISEAGYQVTLGCLLAKGPLLGKLEGSAVSVEEFHPSGGIDSPAGIYQLLRLSRRLRQGKFDIVHTHDLWSNLMGVPAARLAGVKAIISSRRDLGHLDWYQGRRRSWLRRIQNLSHIVQANAGPIRDALISEDGFSPAKLRVIHNGVDVEKFQQARGDREALFPQNQGRKLIVLVGNMHSDVKGHPTVVGAASEVVREFPAARFIFVGDGEQRVAFQQQANRLGLGEHFVFLGRRDDIPEILSVCDIAMLPSRAEGMPNAILEYMASGLPVVATAVGGNTELIEEGRTGLLIPRDDSPAVAAALLRLLRNPAEARQIAANGQKFAAANFSFERLTREVDGLYSELLERSKGSH